MLLKIGRLEEASQALQGLNDINLAADRKIQLKKVRGDIEYSKGNFDEAEKLYEKTIENLEKVPFGHLEAETYISLSKVKNEKEKQELKESADYALKALRIANKGKYHSLLSEALVILSEIVIANKLPSGESKGRKKLELYDCLYEMREKFRRKSLAQRILWR